MRDRIQVKLPSDQTKIADEFAHRLTATRISAGSKHRNNLVIGTDQRFEMDQQAMRAEAVLKYFFGAEASWNTEIDVTRNWVDIPEIVFRNGFYDAKSVSRNSLSLCVYPGGLHRNWRYVLVGCQSMETDLYYLIGWCEGDDIWRYRRPEEKVRGRPAYFIGQGDPLLRDCFDLMPECKDAYQYSSYTCTYYRRT